VNRHAWLQKHPSPLTGGGEFHWYPAGMAVGDRELRAAFVERVRGVEPPAVLWQIERGRVAWGQVFAATAPTDGRRYVGLVLSVVEGERAAHDLLAMLAPPPAAPWVEGVASQARGRELSIQEVAAVRREVQGEVASVVRALLSGGAARVAHPESPRLPAWIASIERLLPELGPKPRCGVWGTSGASDPRDRVAALAAAAWREPGSREASAWTLLCELAAARGESLDQVGRALDGVDVREALTAEEQGMAGSRTVVDVLHAWGRGRLDGSASCDTLAARLADVVAMRVLARLAEGDDAGRAIAEARWYALVPASRRTALLAAAARRTATLRSLVEVHGG